MFKTVVYNISRDIDKLSSKEVTMAKCISDRLEVSLDNYEYEVQLIYNYLLSRDSLKVLKHMNKKEKNK